MLNLGGFQEFHIDNLIQIALVLLLTVQQQEREFIKLTGPTNVFLFPENHMITIIKAQPATTTET